MEIGASLLILTDISVDQIAANLDYSERGNFERSFKRAYSLTPTEFRSQHVPERVAHRRH
jgi:AraC-like DNA-binding protein